jgi:hypothetical protein
MSDLTDKQFLFSLLVSRLIDQAITLGYEVTLGEAYRTPEQAQWNAQKGSGIVNSLHTKRLAIDLQLFKDGKYLTASEDYLPLGRWWELQDPLCRWGGRFHKPDGNHFSMEHEGVK